MLGLVALALLPMQKSLVPTTVGNFPLPDSAARFDYQSIDEAGRRLYLSHMGEDKLIVFDTSKNRVIANLQGYKRVTGVLAVPAEGKIFSSAAGSHEVVITDIKTLKIMARITGAEFPDGIAFVASLRRIFVSDESGGRVLVIDAKRNRRVAVIPLGGEAGNAHYDEVGKRIWVAVQTKNEMVSIDPKSLKITGRFPVEGGDHPHGFTLDPRGQVAYVTCDGNNKLMVMDLRNMKVRQTLDVAKDPDVVTFDKGLQRLYVGCESGEVETFEASKTGLNLKARLLSESAHSVAVDQVTHRLYIPYKSVHGKPVLMVLQPVFN